MELTLYSIIKNGVFTKWRVSDESVARIAIADFKKRGVLDFATIAYSVPNYYVAKDAKIVIHYNQIRQKTCENTV